MPLRVCAHVLQPLTSMLSPIRRSGARASPARRAQGMRTSSRVARVDSRSTVEKKMAPGPDAPTAAVTSALRR
eukprot:6651215-Alexandrium_andersonii.AAC.1